MGGWLMLGLLGGCAAVVWWLHQRRGLPLRHPLPSGGQAFAEMSQRSAAWVARATSGGIGTRERKFDKILAAFLMGASAINFQWIFAATPIALGEMFAAGLWGIAMCIPLIWRRSHPVLITFVVALIGVAHLLAGWPFLFPADLTVLVMLYTIACYGPRWAHRLALIIALIGIVVLGFAMLPVVGSAPDTEAATSLIQWTDYLGDPNFIVSVVLGWVVCLAVWLLGLMRRARFETIAVLHERTRVLHERAERLQVERDQQAQIATAAERARIAREMHDVIAHSLSIIIAQADGGKYAAAANPESATAALDTISTTGRQALLETRNLLGVLRSDDAGLPTVTPADHEMMTVAAPLAPQPGVADLSELFAQAQATGMNLTVSEIGSPVELTPGAALALHRICQEALTNARKHAGPDANVKVCLHWLPEQVELGVIDDGFGLATASASSGYGLIGLQERAAAVGGTLTAGPRPTGGWQLHFTLPITL